MIYGGNTYIKVPKKGNIDREWWGRHIECRWNWYFLLSFGGWGSFLGWWDSSLRTQEKRSSEKKQDYCQSMFFLRGVQGVLDLRYQTLLLRCHLSSTSISTDQSIWVTFSYCVSIRIKYFERSTSGHTYLHVSTCDFICHCRVWTPCVRYSLNYCMVNLVTLLGIYYVTL